MTDNSTTKGENNFDAPVFLATVWRIVFGDKAARSFGVDLDGVGDVEQLVAHVIAYLQRAGKRDGVVDFVIADVVGAAGNDDAIGVARNWNHFVERMLGIGVQRRGAEGEMHHHVFIFGWRGHIGW